MLEFCLCEKVSSILVCRLDAVFPRFFRDALCPGIGAFDAKPAAGAAPRGQRFGTFRFTEV
jgi:hypothetical protein